MATAGLGDSFAKRLEQQVAQARGLVLGDGSRVAVVGGGPAGSLFSYFLLRMAETVGLELAVDLYEPRHFTHSGPAGCNHCGGIVSESLVQMLATEGINLPPTVVQRGIDSYTLHLDVGSVRIETPVQEKRIAAVYRANGPRNSERIDQLGFDRFLQELAAASGARVVRRLVTALGREPDGVDVHCPDGSPERYELVAVAAGVNSHFLESLEPLGVGYKPPVVSKAFICEFRLGRATVEACLGDSMHVFLLDLPRLEFAALIPKGEFATLCLLGEGIDDELVYSFLAAPEVRQCFPNSVAPTSVCHCFPRINLRGATRPFADRVVMIGDTGTTRLYKDGIGAAYRTAKAAARAAVLHGVSEQAFRDHYWPTCRRIEFDNRIGQLIFTVTRQVQRRPPLRRTVLRMTEDEQKTAGSAKRMSTVLWDVFTGSAPYREIFLRSFHPGLLWGLVLNFILSHWPLRKGAAPRQAGRSADQSGEMDTHG